MKQLTLTLTALAAALSLSAGEKVERTLLKTSFREWATYTSVGDNDASTADIERSVTTKYSKETVAFTMHKTNIYKGGEGKVSAICASPKQYLCGMKNSSSPASVTTGAFANITTLSFVERATGSNRGWGLKVKGDGDEDWVVLYQTAIGSSNVTVEVSVNRTNVQLQWYNLSAGNYAAMTDLTIKGMVEDDGTIEKVAVAYYDQKGTYLGEDSVMPNTTFAAKYTKENLTIPEGMLFRGWNDENGVRYSETTQVMEDVDLFACVTAQEQALTGTHYFYNFSNSAFLPQDHDLLVYTDAKHIGVILSDKAYVTYNDGTAHTDYYTDVDTLPLSSESDIRTIEVYNVAGPVEKIGQRYNLVAGDGASLLMVVPQLQNGDTVYLPNGTYDLGETVLTKVSASNVVIMGESMNGAIIRNAPPVEIEGISTTATILNTGTGNKYENLTLQNALDYYKVDNGRAVCLQDKGDKTICYRVRMLSYQDTYYSNKIGAKHYFEECEIHGTVDFICGDGSGYFYNCLLYCEPRKQTGGGEVCITASNADASDKGYVFDRCTIKSECPTVSIGRAWNNAPQCVYLLTTFDYSAGNFSVTKSGSIARWTLAGMNSLPDYLAEYCTMNTAGEVISPVENTITFTYNKTTKQMNTIIGYEDAVQHTYPSFFTDWNPAINYIPFPMPTDIRETYLFGGSNAAHKYLRNGRLLLVRNGIVRDGLGRVIQ